MYRATYMLDNHMIGNKLLLNIVYKFKPYVLDLYIPGSYQEKRPTIKYTIYS